VIILIENILSTYISNRGRQLCLNNK
jgi:hypothetical protein